MIAIPEIIISTFVNSYGFVSGHAEKENNPSPFYGENEPPLNMAYWVELDNEKNEFSIWCDLYDTRFVSLPVVKSSADWASLMLESVRGDGKTFVIPFKEFDEAKNMASILNDVIKGRYLLENAVDNISKKDARQPM